MKNKIKLLDCTLRDGAYILNGKFSTSAIKGIINKLEDADVDIIECGWLKNNEHEVGTSYYHVPADMEQYLSKKKANTTYTVMIDWDRYDLSNLPDCDGNSIDAIRVVFPHDKFVQGIEVGEKIKEKGYKVYFQAANTLAYSEEDLRKLAEAVNACEPVALSVVDTFGAMYEEDLRRIIKTLDKHLKPSIHLGFHSHNNQQLSFALTICFVNILKDRARGIIVDASLCGMGRGAGNATTELVSSYLNRKCDCHYNLDAVMEAIDIYMSYFQEKYEWGYSTPYFIAGMYCCHVNNIAYLLENHRTSAKDMREIIESLAPEERKKYDYDLLEEKYLANQNRNIDDTLAVQTLAEKLKGHEILLIAPGKSSVSEQCKIKNYIAAKNPIVIGINAIVPVYDYDYLFFTNAARYDYAKTSYGEKFEQSPKILLSSVKSTGDSDEYVIRYGNAIKRGWRYFDNAALCCFRVLDYLGIEKAAICGFDGFKEEYNDSYADPFLPSVNAGVAWKELNCEIREMFQDFKSKASNFKHIEFLTDSFFE